MRLFVLLLLVAPRLAHARNVVVFVNMNYSSTEVQAAEEQARARGQCNPDPSKPCIEVIPPQSMIPLVEPMFQKRDQLQEELVRRFPAQNPLVIRSAVAGIMRQGSAWNGNSEIAAFVGSQRMQDLYRTAAQVAAAEKQNGEIYDQLKKKAAELKARGDRVDTMILSSHSDGSNLTGETANRLSANDLARLRKEEPAFFEGTRHVLLLGCYNMTKPNHQVWRHELFPYASMIAGFGIKAPSRFDQTSPNFIRQTMSTGQKIDERVAAANHTLDPLELDRTFKALSSFTTQSHPGVVDYCYQMLEGQPGTFTRDCDTQWRDLYVKKRQMQDYFSLVNPREDPPTVGGGELRAFYNMLQAACPAKDTPSERNDWQASERLRVTLRENVIRLIFWWNIQQSFATYYQLETATMNARIQATGAPAMPKLDGTLSRVSFVASYRSTQAALRQRSPQLAADFEKLYGPLYYLYGESTVGGDDKLSVEATLARGAIPFNWIEGLTVKRRGT